MIEEIKGKIIGGRVIPAKAGIQWLLLFATTSFKTLSAFIPTETHLAFPKTRSEKEYFFVALFS